MSVTCNGENPSAPKTIRKKKKKKTISHCFPPSHDPKRIILSITKDDPGANIQWDLVGFYGDVPFSCCCTSASGSFSASSWWRDCLISFRMRRSFCRRCLRSWRRDLRRCFLSILRAIFFALMPSLRVNKRRTGCRQLFRSWLQGLGWRKNYMTNMNEYEGRTKRRKTTEVKQIDKWLMNYIIRKWVEGQ